MIETESLVDRQILIGVFEGDRAWRSLLALARRNVQRGIELLAQSLIVSPQRERVAPLRGRVGMDQIKRAVLRVVVEFFQNPRFHLGAAIAECDPIEIALNYGFSFVRRLFADSAGRSSGCGKARRSRRGCRRRTLCLHGLVLLRGRRNRLGKIFLEERLKRQHHDKRQQENQHQPLLVAGFMLWILNVWQSYRFLKSCRLQAKLVVVPNSVVGDCCRREFWFRTSFRNRCAASGPGHNPQGKKGDNAEGAARPSALRVPHHSVRRPPSRIRSRSEHSGRPAERSARQPTYKLAAGPA